MIAYRYQKKDGEWQWLQTSSRLVYKNSKPDFVISTHRQLMDEEGRDLLGKRTMDFKVNDWLQCYGNHVRKNSLEKKNLQRCIAGELFRYGTRVNIFLRSGSADCAADGIAKFTTAATDHTSTTNASLQNTTSWFFVNVSIEAQTTATTIAAADLEHGAGKQLIYIIKCKSNTQLYILIFEILSYR